MKKTYSIIIVIGNKFLPFHWLHSLFTCWSQSRGLFVKFSQRLFKHIHNLFYCLVDNPRLIVREGDTMRIDCNPKAFPEAAIEWRRADGTPIIQASRNHHHNISLQTSTFGQKPAQACATYILSSHIQPLPIKLFISSVHRAGGILHALRWHKHGLHSRSDFFFISLAIVSCNKRDLSFAYCCCQKANSTKQLSYWSKFDGTELIKFLIRNSLLIFSL